MRVLSTTLPFGVVVLMLWWRWVLLRWWRLVLWRCLMLLWRYLVLWLGRCRTLRWRCSLVVFLRRSLTL